MRTPYRGTNGPMFCRALLYSILVLAPASLVSAQATESSPQPTQAAEPSSPSPDEDKPAKRDADPMGWLGLTLKIGYAGIRSSNLPNPAYNGGLAAAASVLPDEQRAQYGFDRGGSCSVIHERCKTDGRYGLKIALQLSLGGDGFGWDIEPYLAIAGSAKAYGAYFGPKFDIHILDSLYVGFGLGLKGAWLITDTWDYGADLYGRIPLRATWYAANNLAFVFEFAFGAGATGYAGKAYTVTDPLTGQSFRTTPSLTFGAGRTWDTSFGFRFP